MLQVSPAGVIYSLQAGSSVSAECHDMQSLYTIPHLLQLAIWSALINKTLPQQN